MTAAVIQVADAVVAEINSAALSMPVTAVRAYQPVFDLAELKELHVTVVPKGLGQEIASRGGAPREITVDVAVQKKLERCDAAEIDSLMALVEEIAAHFKFRRLTDAPPAVWIRTENAPIYSQEHLAELRQFTSVVSLTFRTLE